MLPNMLELNWLQTKFVCLKEIFVKNACPENFINKCFKKFTDNIHVLKEATLTVEKKPYALFLPYLGLISLLPKTKLKKPLTNIPHCCNLQVVFIRQQLSFLVSFINFSVDYAVSRVMVNVWDTWLLELVNMLVYHHLQIGTLHRHHCTYSTGLFSLLLIGATLFLLNGLFNYLVMCKCINTTIHVNVTVQYTFFLVMRLIVTTLMSYDLLIVILVTYIFHH